jgi:hypothetical protein
MQYLNEKILGDQLNLIYQNNKFIHDKIVLNSEIKNRPDYHNADLKLIIEFDGFRHYSQSGVIVVDEYKDLIYSKLGYKILRIPYFIQLTSSVIEKYFSIQNVDLNWKYPSGFIDNAALLPADFCELGIERFKKDLNTFWYLKEEIINSIKSKIKEKGDIRLVLPKSLYYLVQ